MESFTCHDCHRQFTDEFLKFANDDGHGICPDCLVLFHNGLGHKPEVEGIRE